MDRFWTFVSCPACSGEGSTLALGGPGVFSGAEDAYLPGESFEPCERCDGGGVVEGCAFCGAPLDDTAVEPCACVGRVPNAA